jgi:hypothetical protein
MQRRWSRARRAILRCRAYAVLSGGVRDSDIDAMYPVGCEPTYVMHIQYAYASALDQEKTSIAARTTAVM